MAEYTYTRQKDSTGQWDIDNTLYVNGSNEMIHLAATLNTDVPTIKFDMVCNGSVATITTSEALDGAQKTTVDNAITAYKAQLGE